MIGSNSKERDSARAKQRSNSNTHLIILRYNMGCFIVREPISRNICHATIRQDMTSSEKKHWRNLPDSQPSRTPSPHVPGKIDYDRKIIYDPSSPVPVVNLHGKFLLASTVGEEGPEEERNTDDECVEPIEAHEDAQLDLEFENAWTAMSPHGKPEAGEAPTTDVAMDTESTKINKVEPKVEVDDEEKASKEPKTDAENVKKPEGNAPKIKREIEDGGSKTKCEKVKTESKQEDVKEEAKEEPQSGRDVVHELHDSDSDEETRGTFQDFETYVKKVDSIF